MQRSVIWICWSWWAGGLGKGPRAGAEDFLPEASRSDSRMRIGRRRDSLAQSLVAPLRLVRTADLFRPGGPDSFADPLDNRKPRHRNVGFWEHRRCGRLVSYPMGYTFGI